MWIEVGTIASFICVKINVDMRLLYLKLLSLYYQEPTSSWFNSKIRLKAQVLCYIKSITFWNGEYVRSSSNRDFFPTPSCSVRSAVVSLEFVIRSYPSWTLCRFFLCGVWKDVGEVIPKKLDLSVVLLSESFSYCYVWFEEEDYTWSSSLINERYCPKLDFWAK